MDTILKWTQRYWLDTLNFIVACGNADLMEQILVQSGRKESVLLTIAVFASELILATAGIWGKRGMIVAFVMFATSIWGIRHIFPETWIIESYFSITIFVSTITSLLRHDREIPQALKSRKPWQWNKLWGWIWKKPAVQASPTAPTPQPINPAAPITWPMPISQLQTMGRAELSRTLRISYDRARQLLEKWNAGTSVDWQWVKDRQI